jgi:hypothetical protein
LLQGRWDFCALRGEPRLSLIVSASPGLMLLDPMGPVSF